jgi:hypothetical protein
VGQVYSFDLVDVDGNKLSTADGHVTTIVLACQSDVDRARVVGERGPDCDGIEIRARALLVSLDRRIDLRRPRVDST